MASSPMGNNPGPAWARALAGQPAAADELLPPTARFLAHLVASATAPRATTQQRIDADLQTWRVLNGDVLSFDEPAARRFVTHCHARAINIDAMRIPTARLEIVPGMGHHPFFSPGLTERIADAIVRHTR